MEKEALTVSTVLLSKGWCTEVQQNLDLYPSQTSYLFIFLLAVNRIKELHKVTVRIPPDNEKSNLIRIEGDPQGVQEAKKELLELASRMVSTNQSSQASCYKLDPDVPLLNIPSLAGE